ncbi:hypothetical protein [Pseudomonas sp.]|jgi:hypothetical protein|uniref:hypothetical protein n=1 Tax=Pseudomonas sp. TaxID=306 RepID=UPI002E2F3BB9|nr:hypothetical protein [Pseudomonas sp.]HEX4547590.1 hypothetical protein [Pseudomonas sp.]
MDIQSSVLDAIFVLYPVHVPGWITPVEPAGSAHGGIPLALYDGSPKGLQCVIDPWTELQQRSVTLAAYDSVALYVQGKTRPVDSATVQPGEESMRIALYVPHGMLVEGVNQLYYVVTRRSGNAETSRVLDVLYYQSAPYNHNLLIPPDVIANGVSAERAAQGVTFTFTYTKPRPFDMVYFRIGSRTFTYEVTDPAAPLSITLYTDDFKAIGDGLAQANFTVTDQLTNNGMSANKTVDIQLGRVEPLLAPKILEAGGNTLVPENAVQTLRGQIDISKLAPTGTLTLSWVAAAGLPAQASFTSAAIPVGTGATRDIPIPVAVVAYSIGKTVTVRYVYTPPGGAALPSPDLTLSISPLSRLSQPWIVQADNSGQGPILDIGKLTANPECRMGVWDHIADRQPVWMILKGTNSDGTSYEKRLWNVPGAAVNTTWIAQGSFPQGWALAEAQKLLDGSSLTVTFKAALDMNQSEALATVFPVRTYTVRTVAIVVPTLTSVTDANGQEVPENGFTTSTTLTLKGKASKGLQVEIYDGSGPSAVPKGTATANASTGDWQLSITVPVGPRRLCAKSLYHPSATYSNVRLLTVQAALTAPTVREAPNNASLAPLAAKDSLTAIVNYPMQAGDKISVTWKGVAGEGSHTTALINAGAQPQSIPLPNSVVAFNLNKTVTVTYTVTRGGVALPASPALTLSVLALPDIALPKPRILQAADAGNGIELNVANLTGNATLRFDPWGLIAIRQPVFLSLNGTYADGRAYNFVIWQSNSGAFVDQNWITNGYEHGVANTELKKLKEGSALNIVFKVGFGKTTNEAEAVTFPLRTYTVRNAVTLPAPTLREAPNNASLAPLAAKDSLTAIVNYPMQAGDKISVTWKGVAGEGSHTTALIDAGAQPQQIPLPNSVVAFNLNKTVTVTYTVTRGGVALPASPALTLSVLALPDIALPKPRIPQAANNGEGPELNLGNFTSIALRMDSYPFMAVGQFWWLRLRGTNANGSVFDTVYWKAPTAVVTQSLINNGFYEFPIAASSLLGLRDGSALTMEFKAALGKSQNEAEAVTFPLRIYTVKAIVDVKPTITNAQDSKGVAIPDGDITVDTTVKLTGSASKGQQVEIFDRTTSKGNATADSSTGIWTKDLTGLSAEAHSFTAKALYGAGQTSGPRTLTVTAAMAPTITNAQNSQGIVIPNGGLTVGKTVKLTGTASKGQQVEIFDGNTSKGNATADPSTGIWTKDLTGLSVAAHSFTAKALYGTGTTSAARTFTVITPPVITGAYNKATGAYVPPGSQYPKYPSWLVFRGTCAACPQYRSLRLLDRQGSGYGIGIAAGATTFEFPNVAPSAPMSLVYGAVEDSNERIESNLYPIHFV